VTRRLIDPIIIAAAAAIALTQSWLRWLDPIVDTGRDLYIAEQLGRGVRLYRDIRYQYPPLAPYLLAAITRVTGHSLAAYAAIGFAQSIAIAFLLWWIGCRVGGRWAGLAAALLFVSVNFTGATTFGANFVFPYSHAATLGMLFILAFVALAIAGRIPAALLCALAAMWCKVEYAVAVLIAVVAFTIAKKLCWPHVVTLAAAFGITLAIVVGIFGAGPLRDNVFSDSLTSGATAQRFFAVVSGAASWQSRVIEAAIGALMLIAIEILRRRQYRKSAIAVAVAAGVFAPWATLFRGCGLLQWAALLRPRDRLMFALAALSIASTLRIALNVAPVWYGFVLIVPLYLLIANATRGDGIWVVLIVAVCAHSLYDQGLRYSVKQFPIVTPRGTLYDSNPDRAAILIAAIPRLRGGTAAVFPEGIALNYFAGAPTTLTYHTFTPVETKDPRVEDRIIGEMSAHPPDRVVLLQRDLREYGAVGFGVDYDQRLRALIASRYEVEQAWSRPQFHLVILKRRH
jgi:hypothetical protein